MINKKAENSSIDWEEIILCLQSFTRSLVNGKGWFRGGKTKVFLKGQEIDDYVFAAIERYLRNPEKYNPSKGLLIDYLRYNLIRSMVSNDLVSAENRTSKDVFVVTDENKDKKDSGLYLDSILPHAHAFFDQEIDYKEVMSYVESEIKSDTIVEEIFLGLCCYGFKRREVIEEFKMNEKDYDNGMRRLNTIRNNAAKRYDIKIQTL